MTVDEIKELIQVVSETGIAELEVQRGENRVRIRRATAPQPQEFVLPADPMLTHVAPHVGQHVPPSLSQAGGVHPASLPAAPAAAEAADRAYVKSPIVGTFYGSPSPEAPPFVKVGDRVSPGQVLCIIESMKLMNEIEADMTGVVESKLVQNGQPVEYGEALFGIRPV